MGTLFEAKEYRQTLKAAFPSRPFHGLVSKHDECDDGIFLRQNLPGKRWDKLSPVAAFLPAWLLRSLETSDEDDPIVLEFTLYFLCPGNHDDGWDELRIAGLIRLFNLQQRAAVADFLRFVANWATSGDWKQRAEFGLTWWRPE